MNKANPKQIGFAILLLIVFMVGVYFFIQSEANEFDQNGIAKSATITKLYSLREVKTHGKGGFETNYYANVSFFIKENDSRTGSKDMAEEPMSEKKKSLDDIIEGIDFTVEVGDYNTATLKISEDEFKNLKGAKNVDILYLKNNPKEVILRSRIDK